MSKLKCGGLKKFTVIKDEDIGKYMSGMQEYILHQSLRDICEGRRKDGKNSFNEYIVINTDEPYINEIIEILKKNGHWGEGE